MRLPKLTGYLEEDLVGTHFTALIVSGWKAKVQKFYSDQFASRTYETMLEFPIICNSGQLRWVEQKVTLLMDKGEATGVQGVVRDITERRWAEEAATELAVV